MCVPAPVTDCASAFRVEDQKEISSVPRVLYQTPQLTSGGWCGSKMSE